MLGPEECLRLLGQRSLGRVGFVADGVPVILPVNYRLVHRDVLFRAAAGTVLSVALRNLTVSFESDWFDDTAHQGWSVLAVGAASALAVDAEAGSGLVRPWAHGRGHHLVRIAIAEVTGRRIQRRRTGIAL